MCQSTEFLSLSKRNQKRLSLDSDPLAFLSPLFPFFLPLFFSSIFLSFFLWKEWETASLYSSVWPVTEFYTRMDSDSKQSSCCGLLSIKVKVWATTPGSIFLRSGSGKKIETVQSFCSRLHRTSFPVVHGFPSVSYFFLTPVFLHSSHFCAIHSLWLWAGPGQLFLRNRALQECWALASLISFRRR